ncbi:MAG: hypothetical protein HC765_15775 [Brachymonas sp.]|nr:hypothetical protein [Brachymonas sp.]
MPLSLADDPDGQIPMPFEAADHYAQWVMSQARQTDFAGLNVRLALAYGSHPLQCCDVFIPQKSPCSATLIFGMAAAGPMATARMCISWRNMFAP